MFSSHELTQLIVISYSPYPLSTTGPYIFLGQKDYIKRNSNDTIGNRIRDLPACSTVPQPTAPPCAPVVLSRMWKLECIKRYRRIEILPSTWKLKAASPSELLVSILQNTKHHIPTSPSSADEWIEMWNLRFWKQRYWKHTSYVRGKWNWAPAQLGMTAVSSARDGKCPML